MASLPSQSSPPSSSRQPIPSSPTPEESGLQQTRRPSQPQSSTSEDSQIVLLDNASLNSPKVLEQQAPASPQARASSSDSEPRKCWICFSDETEDNPTSSAWRSPCPCALTAHEACLLDWVADLEAPNRRKRTGAPAKIQCPQCKAEITIARPRSLIVQGVNAIEQATGRLVLPMVLVTLVSSVTTGCWMHGFSTVYLMFGPQDADRLFGFNTGRITGNWGMSLPFIPVVLVLSRTTFADSVLPILPIFYFATQVPTRNATSLWPPSAAMTVASLPYLRLAYNEIYKRVFAKREQAWIKEVQPRAEENAEAGAENQDRADQDVGEAVAGINFELDVEVVVEDEPEEAQAPQNPPAVDIHNNLQQEVMNHMEAHQHGGQAEGRQGNIIISTSHLAETIIGALLFPTISTAMGAILKVILPRTWTAPLRPWDRHRGGFLQSRWGRSIVGGCLFVVLKDTLLLYSKFRLAQDHRKRRVVDYDPVKGKKPKAGGR